MPTPARALSPSATARRIWVLACVYAESSVCGSLLEREKFQPEMSSA
jgi:hypothetical protein